MLKERAAITLKPETPTEELVSLWFAAEEESNREDGEQSSETDYFRTYWQFKVLFESGGDGLARFGNQMNDLLRDSKLTLHSDYLRYYIENARRVMQAEGPGTKRYFQAKQVGEVMKYAWLSAMEKMKDPMMKLREVISFATDLKPENAAEMIEAQAKKVLTALPPYRLVATEYPYPRKIEDLPEGYPGKRNIVAHGKALEHWWGLVWLAEAAKERGLTAVYEKANAYLLGALDNIDVCNTDGLVVGCLLEYYGESDVSEKQKREMVARCLSLFTGKEGYHGQSRVVVGAVKVLLSLSDFEGAVSLWKQYPKYTDEPGLLPSMMMYAFEHNLVDRFRAERDWFKNNVWKENDRRHFSKWRLNWTFAARRVADKDVKFDYTMPEILEEVEIGTTGLRIQASIAMANQEQTRFVEAVKTRLDREIEKLLAWKQEESWEHYPYGDLQECIEAILILRGELS